MFERKKKLKIESVLVSRAEEEEEDKLKREMNEKNVSISPLAQNVKKKISASLLIKLNGNEKH